jgi:hypothetical protein
MKPSRARAVEADRLEVVAVQVEAVLAAVAVAVSVVAETGAAVAAAADRVAVAVVAAVAAAVAADAHTRLVRKPGAAPERFFLTSKDAKKYKHL